MCVSIFECAKSVYWLNVIRGYYHFSSHKRDDFLVRNPGFDRVNYVRDMLILGYAWYWTNNLRLYGDAGWIYTDVADDHTHLREESNYSGNFVVQAGRAWRGDRTSHLLRAGLYYHNGLSNQLTFYNRFEQQIGAGLWYDF